jgi:hypothetical protein
MAAAFSDIVAGFITTTRLGHKLTLTQIRTILGLVKMFLPLAQAVL